MGLNATVFKPLCEHCYHLFKGVLHMVVPDGHIVQMCCKCKGKRTVHPEHAYAE